MSENYQVSSPITPVAPPSPAAVADPAPIAVNPDPAAVNAPAPAPAPAKTLELGKKPERPSWLPEEYKTPEDFRRVYDELRAKQSGKEEKTLVSDQDLNGYMQEVISAGSLSDGSRRALRAKGFTDGLIDQYLTGLGAIRENQMNKTFAIAGGAEKYAKMSEWASANLPATDQQNYNVAVNSGNPAIVEMAVAGLKARYDLANGNGDVSPLRQAPTRLSGGAPSGSLGVRMFASMQEQVRAQGDPRYATDPNYRASVEAMIDASIKAGKY